jgi:CelD/BcsL family acetyltransferase involved in cellulose biosynthesis
VKASVCRPGDLGAGEIEQWRAFQGAAGLETPFLAPEFSQAVGEVFSSARVAVVHDGPDLVGFLPFTSLPFRAASAIGGYLSGIQAFVPSGGEWTFEAVLRAARIELFEFGRLLAHQRPASATAHELEAGAIDLAEGFEAFLAVARQAKFVKEMERKRRRLEREDPELRFEFGTHDLPAVAQLVAWKSDQLVRTGRPDMFARPGVRELLERIASADSPAMTGSVSYLRSGARLLAVDVGIRSATVFAGWRTAYDVAEAPKSPGAVNLLCVLEAAAAAGLQRVDMGAGEETFKSRLANRTLTLLEGYVGRATVGRRVSTRIRRLLRKESEA